MGKLERTTGGVGFCFEYEYVPWEREEVGSSDRARWTEVDVGSAHFSSGFRAAEEKEDFVI